MGKVVVVGSINVDLVVTADRFPRPGETLIGNSFARHPGGKGANQAIAAARMGARTIMIGAVGADPFGAFMRDTLSQAGVDTGLVRSLPDVADRHSRDHRGRRRKQHCRGRGGQRQARCRGWLAADRARRCGRRAAGGPLCVMVRGVQGGPRRRGDDDPQRGSGKRGDRRLASAVRHRRRERDRAWIVERPIALGGRRRFRSSGSECGRSAAPRTRSS